jgi:hypothetical protein
VRGGGLPGVRPDLPQCFIFDAGRRLDRPREPCQCWVVEQRADWDLDAEPAPHANDDLRRKQRIAAQIEKIVSGVGGTRAGSQFRL